MLMESSTSAVNWQPRNLAKRPGEMLRNSLTHVARGSDSVMFFQWRASRAGAEKFHSAMLPHAGTGSRVWRELLDLSGALASLEQVAGSRVQADVGILWDWNAWWALDLEYRPSVDVSYRGAVDAAYGALWRRNLTVEFVRPGDIPSHLPVLLVPSLYLCRPETAEALRRYVEGGGRLLVRFFSGIVDETDAVHPGAYPGALRELLGIRVEEFHPLAAGAEVALSDGSTARTWSEAVEPAGAEVVASFAGGPDAGAPALTRHAVGAGAAWYLATEPDQDGLDAVLTRVLADAGITGPDTPAGLERVRRAAAGICFDFLINHGDAEARVTGHGVDLLTGQQHEGTVTVPAGGVVVLRSPATTPEEDS
jgi:beta-galactosidase